MKPNQKSTVFKYLLSRTSNHRRNFKRSTKTRFTPQDQDQYHTDHACESRNHSQSQIFLPECDPYTILEGEQPPTSPLLTLPAEIRQQILALLLSNKHVHVLTSMTERSETDLTYHVFPPLHQLPELYYKSAFASANRYYTPPDKKYIKTISSIWLVCKRLYVESLPLIYRNTFSWSDDQTCHNFLRRLTLSKLMCIKEIWVQNIYVSEAAFVAYENAFRGHTAEFEDGNEGPRWDVTVYIASQTEILRRLGITSYASSVTYHTAFAKGWVEKVDGMLEYWTPRVRQVLVVEIDRDSLDGVRLRNVVS